MKRLIAQTLRLFHSLNEQLSTIFTTFVCCLLVTICCPLVNGQTNNYSYNNTPPALQSQTLQILYGNFFKYHLYNKSTEILLNVACKNEPAYIDYSFQYNSYVVVCNENNVARIRILPINTKEKAKLAADRNILKRVEMPHRSNYAFDWIHGLLYFTEEKLIYVVDLKQAESDEVLIYNTNKSCIVTGLVVEPERATLFWMEHYNGEIITDFIEARQDGGKPVRRFRKQQSNLEILKYDYLTETFLALVVRTRNERTGWMFSKNNIEKQTEISISVPNRQVTQVAFYNRTLIYVAVSSTPEESREESTIMWWDLGKGDSVNQYNQLQTIRFKPLTLTFMDLDARPNNLDNLCEKNKCKEDETDFCIPSSLETYVCKSEPLKIHQSDRIGFFRSLFRGKRAFLTVGLLILFVALAVVGFLALSKKKVRFYQIRLKSINRVNSSKLEQKGAGTNEIAE